MWKACQKNDSVIGTIFEVNSNIGKLWYLLRYFNGKDTVDFIKYHLINNSIMLYVQMTIVQVLPRPCDTFPFASTFFSSVHNQLM